MAFAPGSLSNDAAAWKGQSLVGVQQLDEAGLNLVPTHAERLRGQPRDKVSARQRGKILANVFYEPSTRTSCSFQAAMLRLGGSVFCVAEATSSAKKGETLEDTARSLACYADVLVLRHPESGAAKRAAVASRKPTLNAGDGVYNSVKGQRERVGRMLQMHANDRTEVKSAVAGDIIAVAGLKQTTTGETLCDKDNAVILEKMDFPEPVISVAVEAKSKKDQDKMGEAVARVAAEDPSFRTKYDEENAQTIISGMGELHLEIIVDRLQREFGVEANVGAPQVSYREAITAPAEVDFTHKKQSGGSGQYARCKVQFEPLDGEESADFVFASEIKGGAVP